VAIAVFLTHDNVGTVVAVKSKSTQFTRIALMEIVANALGHVINDLAFTKAIAIIGTNQRNRAVITSVAVDTGLTASTQCVVGAVAGRYI
jgi:hypothetical protein